MTEPKGTSALPDRLSNDPKSPYYNAELLERDVGVRFKGVEKTNVAEYCISEGWIKVEADRLIANALIKRSMRVRRAPEPRRIGAAPAACPAWVLYPGAAAGSGSYASAG